MDTFEITNQFGELKKKKDTNSKVNSKLYLNYWLQPSELQALSPSFHQQNCTGTEHQDLQYPVTIK
jgi:hypothetical protein